MKRKTKSNKSRTAKVGAARTAEIIHIGVRVRKNLTKSFVFCSILLIKKNGLCEGLSQKKVLNS